MRTRYGYNLLKWSREKCAQWLKKAGCPECKSNRIYPGTDTDRFRGTCLNCGCRFAYKPPKEALRDSPALW